MNNIHDENKKLTEKTKSQESSA